MAFKTNPRATVGGFLDAESQARFTAAYEAMRDTWPSPPEPIDVPTGFGITRIHRAGVQGGTPIVLLHPLGGTSLAWAKNAAALGEHHPLYAVDFLTDAGMSQPERPLTGGHDVARWLDDVLDGLGLDRVHLVGLSLGGLVVMNHLVESPSRVLTATSAEPTGVITAPRIGFVASMVGTVLGYAVTRRKEHFLRLARTLGGSPEVLEGPWKDLVLSSMTDHRATQLLWAKLGDEQLRGITVPLQLLLAEHSPIFRLEATASRAQELIPNVTVGIVPEVGHAIALERPDVFNRLVLGFIESHDT